MIGRRTSDEREVRAARNQAIFRAVNEKLREINETFDAITGSFAVACECAEVDCVQLIELPIVAYEEVRRSPRTFVVLPDHVQPDVERVMSTHNGYAVVEAVGRGAHIADATFPGRRPACSGR